jgi:ABC-2 type transport system permease protein
VSLFRTEVRRLVKRRFVRYLTLAGLLVLVAVAVGTFLTNKPVTAEQIAAAERMAERDYQQNITMVEQERRECERVRAGEGSADPGRFPPDCAMIQPPPREAFQAQWYMPPSFDFRGKFEPMITAFAAILALVAFAAGASFVGAEWSSGGMMNLLLWRPRRLQVLLTKLAALLTGVITLFVLAAAAYTAGFWTIGRYRGTNTGMTDGTWQSFALTGLRGLALVLAAGAIGFGLASLGRHTALALGGAIGVAVVGQFGLGILLAVAQVRFFEAWLLPIQVQAWMDKKVTLQDWRSCEMSFSGQCEPAKMDITWHDSGLLIAAGVVVVVGAALWAMRRRDIT